MKKITGSDFKVIISGETGSVAFDKSTTSVKLKRGSHAHVISEGPAERIKKGDASGFYNLYNYIFRWLQKTGQVTD